MAGKEKEQRFDQVKLQGFQDPLTVRVEKKRGDVRQPIELPTKGSPEEGFQPPGVGWSRDEVLGLENFILTKWSGGGHYEFTVTDAKGDRMTWSAVWDPRLFPERIPPNALEAAVVGAGTTTAPVNGPQPVPANVQPFGVASGWPASHAVGYQTPPHTGPLMMSAPAPAPTPAPAPAATQPATSTPAHQALPMTAPSQPSISSGGHYVQIPGPNGPQWVWQPAGAAPVIGGNGWDGPQIARGAGLRRRGMPALDDDDDLFGANFGRRPAIAPTAPRADDEKRVLEERVRAFELEKKDLEYKAALERQQRDHETQMKALQEELRRLGDNRNKGEDNEVQRLREDAQRQREEAQRQRELMLEQQAAMQRQMMEAQLQGMREQMAQMLTAQQAPRESDELRLIRAEQERLRQEAERQRQDSERRLEAERLQRERERERFEQQRRDEIMQRELKEAREATERRIEALTVASQNRGNDPVVEALKEQARQSGEQMREIARMQQASSDRMAQFMVAPGQLAQIIKENASGSDVVMRNLVDTVSGIGNMYKTAAEQMMSMSGGGSEPPAMRLIQEGLGRASEVAERFLAVKRDAVISDGKVKQAQAHTEATKIAAEVQLRTAAMQAQRWAPPQGGGLNGAPVSAAAVAPGAPASAPAAQPTAAARPANTGTNGAGTAKSGTTPAPGVQAGAATPSTGGTTPAVGPTEEELFGLTYESVMRLRKGVADGKLDPNGTIDAILKGVQHVMANNIVVPAFTLFSSERWADFIDVMIPTAPQAFKDECVRILIEEVEVSDGDDDDGDDDDDDGDDGDASASASA